MTATDAPVPHDPLFMREMVVIESPYMGRPAAWWPKWLRWLPAWWLRRRNAQYALACMLDSINRDEAPFASHVLYTGVLRDSRNMERAIGMYCGFVWGARAALRAVYCDRGISSGMTIGIAQRPRGQRLEYRYIRTPTYLIPTCELCGDAAPPNHNRCGGVQCQKRSTARY